jgi:cobaltochelatase CobS
MSFSLPHTAALAGAALHLSDGTLTRTALRKVAGHVLDDWCRNAAQKARLTRAIKDSPLVHPNGPLTIRPTAAGIRDAVSSTVLADIACWGGAAIDQMMDALISPSRYGVPQKATTTGYALGAHMHRTYEKTIKDAKALAVSWAQTNGCPPNIVADALCHVGIDRTLANEIERVLYLATPTTLTTGTTTTNGDTFMKLPLTELAIIHDNLVAAGHASGDVTDTMAKTLVEVGQPEEAVASLMNGLRAFIAARPDVPNPIPELTLEDARKFAGMVERAFSGAADTEEVVGEASEIVPVQVVAVPELPEINLTEQSRNMLNAVLASQGLPTMDSIVDALKLQHTTAMEAAQKAAELQGVVTRTAMQAAMPSTVEGQAEQQLDADGKPIPSQGLPEGKVVMRKAADVFKISGGAAKAFQFEVPTFQWAYPHPHVPDLDADYLFRPDMLITLLVSLVKNQPPWLAGHTGTGKSTFVEQVAARLQWPLLRVNFDSEITRMDLVGRDTLKTDPATGTTVTEWVDGILPTALKGPYILLLDEISFVRPDVSYVLQRALEGKGLLLTENGGELVRPHAMNRIIATDNTVGQGDEFGMYQGARPQSMAFLDRFNPFIHVGYLKEAEELALIQKRAPTIPPAVAKLIARYVAEHRQAFTNAEVLQPISPRGVIGLAEQFVTFRSIYGDDKKATKRAFEDMVLAKASQQDKAVLQGIVDRVSK